MADKKKPIDQMTAEDFEELGTEELHAIREELCAERDQIAEKLVVIQAVIDRKETAAAIVEKAKSAASAMSAEERAALIEEINKLPEPATQTISVAGIPTEETPGQVGQ